MRRAAPAPRLRPLRAELLRRRSDPHRRRLQPGARPLAPIAIRRSAHTSAISTSTPRSPSTCGPTMSAPRPADAYRFARGETIHLPPLDGDGNLTRPVTLARPLDFAAVTDHDRVPRRDASAPRRDRPGTTRPHARRTGRRSARFSGSTWARFPGSIRHARRRCLGLPLGRSAGVEESRTRPRGGVRPHLGLLLHELVAYEYSLLRSAPTAPQRHLPQRQGPEHAHRLLRGAHPARALEAARRRLRSREERLRRALPSAQLEPLQWPDVRRRDPPAPRPRKSGASSAGCARRWSRSWRSTSTEGDSECTNGLSTALGPPDELCDFEKIRPSRPPTAAWRHRIGAFAGLGCTSGETTCAGPASGCRRS